MQEDFHDADLARWLQEAGRRRVVRPAAASEATSAPATAVAASAAKAQRNLRARYLFLFSLAALSYLPYFYADVYLQIATLPRVIVFV